MVGRKRERERERGKKKREGEGRRSERVHSVQFSGSAQCRARLVPMNFGSGSKNKDGKYRTIPQHDRGDGNADENDDFIMSAVRSQQQMMEEQDESLDVLGQGAARLGMISMEISAELSSQNKMLDEMDKDLDSTELNLEVVTKKTQELIKKSGGCRYFAAIICLSFVVVLLFFLILYT